MKILAIAFALVLLSACVSSPPPAPLNTRSAMNIEAGLTRNVDKIFQVYKTFLHESDVPKKSKVIFEFVVEPDGSVRRAKIINNQVSSAPLREQLLAALKSFDFGVLEVGPTDVTYTVDFEN